MTNRPQCHHLLVIEQLLMFVKPTSVLEVPITFIQLFSIILSD